MHDMPQADLVVVQAIADAEGQGDDVDTDVDRKRRLRAERSAALAYDPEQRALRDALVSRMNAGDSDADGSGGEGGGLGGLTVRQRAAPDNATATVRPQPACQPHPCVLVASSTMRLHSVTSVRGTGLFARIHPPHAIHFLQIRAHASTSACVCIAISNPIPAIPRNSLSRTYVQLLSWNHCLMRTCGSTRGMNIAYTTDCCGLSASEHSCRGRPHIDVQHARMFTGRPCEQELAGEVPEAAAAADLDRYFAAQDDLPGNDAHFLRDYFRRRLWTEEGDDAGESTGAVLRAGPAGGLAGPMADVEEDEDFLDRADQFEYQYNFRYASGFSDVLLFVRVEPVLRGDADDGMC